MKKSRLLFLLAAALLLFCRSKDPLTPYAFPEMSRFPGMPSSPTNPVTVEGSELGRFLFYDPVLSSDSSVSCSSCHKQQYAFSDAPNRFSSGVGKALTSRNTKPLFNLAWAPSFFYDGRARTLEDQVSHPITAKNEMNMQWGPLLKRLNASAFYRKKFKTVSGGKIDSTLVKNMIGQFLRTLVSFQSRFDNSIEGKKLTKEEFNGFRLMNDQTRADCLHCHPTDGSALMTTFMFSNNGLDETKLPSEYQDKGRGAITGNEKENGKFMIPSLRNIALTAPYMHDGRFATLEEVVDFYSEGVHSSVNIDSKMEYAYQKGVKLSQTEKKEVLAFLRTLTDSVFISNKAFSDPFVK